MLEPRHYRSIWLNGWELAEKYFRYEVEGFEHLVNSRPGLMVIYHGRPLSWDGFILLGKMDRELGYVPAAAWLDTWGKLPFFKHVVPSLQGIYEFPSDELIAELHARGEHFIVLPGGTKEGFRPFWRSYSVDFGHRRGYIRLALRHRMPIIPIVADGTDRAFIGVNDGYKLSRRLFKGNGGIPVWLGFGLGGIFPFALPLPVKIRQKIGAPIDLEALRQPGQTDAEHVEAAHAHVAGTMQRMLDDLRARRTS